MLLNYARHTALAIEGGRIVQASINERGTATGGTPGDQTGREISERSYYNYPWDCVLRYVGDGAVTDASSEYVPSYWYNVALPLLKPGMTGHSVNTVQHLLRAYGYYDGAVTGTMDAATVEAVRGYQASQWLDIDGEVGVMTWGVLLQRG